MKGSQPKKKLMESLLRFFSPLLFSPLLQPHPKCERRKKHNDCFPSRTSCKRGAGYTSAIDVEFFCGVVGHKKGFLKTEPYFACT